MKDKFMKVKDMVEGVKFNVRASVWFVEYEAQHHYDEDSVFADKLCIKYTAEYNGKRCEMELTHNSWHVENACRFFEESPESFSQFSEKEQNHVSEIVFESVGDLYDLYVDYLDTPSYAPYKPHEEPDPNRINDNEDNQAFWEWRNTLDDDEIDSIESDDNYDIDDDDGCRDCGRDWDECGCGGWGDKPNYDEDENEW